MRGVGFAYSKFPGELARTRRRDLCWTSWAGPSDHPDARVRVHEEPRGFNKKKHFTHLQMLVRSLKIFYFILLALQFFPE
jgi:hypothetical protein